MSAESRRRPRLQSSARENSSALPTVRVKPHRWPTWLLIALSVVGVVVAAVASSQLGTQSRMTYAIVGFVGVLLVGAGLMFAQRILNVSASRRSGDLGHLDFRLVDRVAVGLLVIASVANGVVIALQMARQ